MLRIGDCVCHKITSQVGKIVGYGHEIQDGIYSTTIIVQIKGLGLSRSNFMEDVFSAWFLTEAL